ncbi:MAG: UPF0236 family transposase-like protein [Bacillota bacterium]
MERAVFGRFLEVMAEGLAEILQAIDDRIAEERDKQRYEIKGRVSRTVETLVVPVEFGRQYYRDWVSGKPVFLLDEMLSLPEGQRVAPGLGALVAMLGVQGPFLRLGERVERDDEAARDEPDGKRQVPVLFVEADGLVASMQQERSLNQEIKMVMSHEGWSPRNPASDEYELLQRNYHVTLDGKDFWEEASRKLYSIYDIDEKTWPVINGDRAGWIREGVKYFPRAIYQIVQSLAKQFEGRLEQASEELNQTTLEKVEKRLRAGAGHVAREIAEAFQFKQAIH